MSRGLGSSRNRRTPPGRAVGQLLADHGHRLPQRTTPEPEAGEGRLFPKLRSPRGLRERGAGWSGGYAPLSQWRMTSDQAPVFWPFIAAPILPPTGAQMGIDEWSGGSFFCDPNGWVLDDEIPVTNPNVFVMGKPGTGKSSCVKQFIIRMLEFGYRALILGDSKDEYEALCAAFGVTPFTIGPGQPTRVNPLDIGPLAAGTSCTSRRPPGGPRSSSPAGSSSSAAWSAPSTSASSGSRSPRPTNASSTPCCVS